MFGGWEYKGIDEIILHLRNAHKNTNIFRGPVHNQILIRGNFMGFKEDIQTLAIQITEKKQYIDNEETTKNSLILPFIQILGYDIFNPLEVKPEFLADYEPKKSSKVDYAIFKDDNPIIFIEAKSVNENLSNFDSQLAFYFNATSEVKLGILTNGDEYRFFTDLKTPNHMDEVPFLVLSLSNLKDLDIENLARFKKDTYDHEELFKFAEDLHYTSALNASLKNLLKTPNDKFIKYLIKDCEDMKDFTVTVNVIERFRPIVKKAINNAILDIVSKGISGTQDGAPSLGNGDAEKTRVKSTHVEGKEANADSLIETTDEELEAYDIVKTLLEFAGKDISEIQYKDTINYFSIYNHSVTRWFMRLVLRDEKKSFAIKMEPEKAKAFLKDFTVESAPDHLGGGARIYLNSIEDLKKMQSLIVSCFNEVAGT